MNPDLKLNNHVFKMGMKLHNEKCNYIIKFKMNMKWIIKYSKWNWNYVMNNEMYNHTFNMNMNLHNQQWNG